MKYFNRRFMLQGLGGITLGLPFLEGLVPRTARAQAVAGPKRVMVFFEVNGVKMDKFFPKTSATGALTDAMFTGTALEALIPYKAKLLIPRGIEMTPPGFDGSLAGCDHQRGMGCKLTAAPLDMSSHLATGVSVDQLIAQKLNPPGRQALTLSVGYKDNTPLGYISFTGSKQPVQGENNPWYAYRTFMTQGASDAGTAPPPQMIDVAAKRKSVIDLVEDDFTNLKKSKLSTNDVAKLDMHLTIIRQLEMSMNTTPDAGSTSGPVLGCGLSSARTAEIQGVNAGTVADDNNFEKISQMQIDVIALALACNYTRAGSLLLGRGAGGPVYKWLDPNVKYNHHPLSHRASDDASASLPAGYDAETQLFEIDSWHARQFALLLSRLDGYTEGNGTVLDNTAVVWMNELSDGQGHDFRDLPVVIGGGLGGYLKQGQFINVKSGNSYIPHNTLYTTLLNGIGIPTTHFGATGYNAKDGEIASIKA